MALTEAEWTKLLLKLSPPDLKAMCDLIVGTAEWERTGERAALHIALMAFKARVEEKERIAKN